MPRRDTAPIGAPCWIDIMSSDIAKTRAFYGELFAWTSEDPSSEHGGYLNFAKDGIAVAGGMPKPPDMEDMPDMWSVYLATDDVEALAKRVSANGGQVIVPPMPVDELGHFAVFADPGGAGIGAWQPGEMRGFGVIAEPGAPSWFELHTRAYDTSVAFYRDVFGWDVHAMSETPEFRYTTLGEGDGALAGIMDASAMLPEGEPARWSIYFGVENTDAAITKAVGLGATVVRPAEDSPYGRLAELIDSTGASFKLVGQT